MLSMTKTIPMVSVAPPDLRRVGSCDLPRPDRVGSPALIGIDADGNVALELMYGADGSGDWLAQVVIDANGTLIDQRDENYGENVDFVPLDLTALQIAPRPIPDAARHLVFAGGRWRGLREADRVMDTLYPLSVAEKMALSLALTGPILGIVESRIVAAASITERWTLLCRQVRIAFGVPLSRDNDGLPYDYDSRLLCFAQWLDHEALPPDLSGTTDDAASLIHNLASQSRTTFAAQPTDLLYDSTRRRLYLIDTPDSAHAAMHIYQCG